MLNQKLNVGDYILDPKGIVYRITRVNKTTYHAESVTGMWNSATVPVNGLYHHWAGYTVEYFPCDDVTAQIINGLQNRISCLEGQISKLKEAAEAVKNMKKNLSFLMEADLRTALHGPSDDDGLDEDEDV